MKSENIEKVNTLSKASIKRYDNLNGLRAIAAIGILMMHVEDNMAPVLPSSIHLLIAAFDSFTYLFFTISAFSMCCGYYEKFKYNDIDIENFYKRRFQRIWPFFAFMCTIALIVSFSKKSIYEYLADLTLMFGLIPNNGIEIIGVGWFLGTIFLFYMLFPFFVFLINNEQRAWSALAVSIMLCWLTFVRFTSVNDRDSLIFSGSFFIIGGIIYIYRDRIAQHTILCRILLPFFIALYFIEKPVFAQTLLRICISALILSVALCPHNIRFLNNRITRFLSKISLEIYLCHMMSFRLIQKIGLDHVLGDNGGSYLFTVCLTLAVSICFIKVSNIIIRQFKIFICDFGAKKQHG